MKQQKEEEMKLSIKMERREFNKFHPTLNKTFSNSKLPVIGKESTKPLNKCFLSPDSQ